MKQAINSFAQLHICPLPFARRAAVVESNIQHLPGSAQPFLLRRRIMSAFDALRLGLGDQELLLKVADRIAVLDRGCFAARKGCAGVVPRAGRAQPLSLPHRLDHRHGRCLAQIRHGRIVNELGQIQFVVGPAGEDFIMQRHGPRPILPHPLSAFAAPPEPGQRRRRLIAVLIIDPLTRGKEPRGLKLFHPAPLSVVDINSDSRGIAVFGAGRRGAQYRCIQACAEERFLAMKPQAEMKIGLISTCSKDTS